MRNDIKPVVRPVVTPRTPRDAGVGGDDPHVDGGVSDGGSAGGKFDAPGTPGVRRERGDAVDPAGPKPTTSVRNNTNAGAIDDPSGTTGPVSRSNSRTTTTTGKLRDRDLERSARTSEYPDVRALDTPGWTGNLPLFVGVVLGVILLLGIVAWFTWPGRPTVDDNATRPRDTTRVLQDTEAMFYGGRHPADDTADPTLPADTQPIQPAPVRPAPVRSVDASPVEPTGRAVVREGR